MKIPVSQIKFELTVGTEELKSEIEDIAASLKDIGLSHPVIVRANGEGDYILVSGEKRIRAAQVLGWKEIESEVRNVTEVEGKIIQTHENLKRHNLPWWESAALIEALHKYRQEQHGTGQTGRPKQDEGKQGWGQRDTERELGIAIGSVSDSLKLAAAVRTNPALKNIKDKKTAIRLVRIEASRIQAEEEAGLPTNLDVNCAYLGDSATILSALPAQCIDHCITDPPWINFFEESLVLDQRTIPVFKEIYRVLQHQGFLYIFCGLDDYSYYCGYDRRGTRGEVIHTNGELEKIGFKVSKTPIIWHKTSSLSRRGVRSWEYDRDFEFIIVATKGSPSLTSPVVLSGVKPYNVVPSMKLIHPNEKPVELLKDLIKDCSYEGNIILDPFGGSFATAQAARELKRRFIVCERDKKTYDLGRKRIGFNED
jgi:DNA modification methylase